MPIPKAIVATICDDEDASARLRFCPSAKQVAYNDLVGCHEFILHGCPQLGSHSGVIAVSVEACTLQDVAHSLGLIMCLDIDDRRSFMLLKESGEVSFFCSVRNKRPGK